MQELRNGESSCRLRESRQLVQQICANVHAAFVCKSYFISHAWMKVCCKPCCMPDYMALQYGTLWHCHPESSCCKVNCLRLMLVGSAAYRLEW